MYLRKIVKFRDCSRCVCIRGEQITPRWLHSSYSFK